MNNQYPKQSSNVNQYNLSEPVLFEYDYRLPIPLRISAAVLLFITIAGPVVLMILSETLRKHLPDNFIFIFVLIPGLFNLIFYKKKYIFTQRGIYIAGRQKGKLAGESSPALLMEWGDYDRFKKTMFGFKMFSRVRVEEYGHSDFQEGVPDLSKVMIGTGSVSIHCDSENQSQVEYFLISRNIHPGEIG